MANTDPDPDAWTVGTVPCGGQCGRRFPRWSADGLETTLVICDECSKKPLQPSFRARTAKLLREIEWSGDDGGQERGSPCCPKCGAVQATKWAKTPTPHATDCALAALLREAEAP